MTNRAGTLVSNLSGELAYESFRPTLLPPNPPIEVSGELFTKRMHSSQEALDLSLIHISGPATTWPLRTSTDSAA